MERTSRHNLVYKNSFVLTFLRVIEPAMAMVVIVAVSRLLGTEVMGSYAFIITFVYLFSAIGQLGLQVLLTREVAANKEMSSSYLSGALLLGLGSSIILAVVMNGTKRYFNLPPDVNFAVFLMSLNLFPIFILATFDAIFMGWERTDALLYASVSGNLLRVGLSLLFLRMGFGLISLVVAILISTVFSVGVCALAYIRHLGKISLQVNVRVSLDLLKASPVFLFITFFAILSARLDILMLTKLTDMTQVALYSAAFKLFEAATIVPQSYIRASFPHLSALFRSRPDAFGRTYQHMLRNVLFFIFPAAGLTLAIAPLLTAMLYGEKFAGSAMLLQIFAIGLIPWTIGRTTANILFTTNFQRYDLICGIFGVVTALVLYLYMIPLYGAAGAAVASVAAWSVFFLSEFCFSRKAGYSINLFRALGRPLAAGVAIFLIARVAMFGQVYALLQWALLAVAAFVYLRDGRRRQKVVRSMTLVRDILRAKGAD